MNFQTYKNRCLTLDGNIIHTIHMEQDIHNQNRISNSNKTRLN